MINILKSFDAAEKGQKSSSTSANDTNNMKKILESFNKVQECGMEGMEMAQSSSPASISITATGESGDEVARMIAMLGAKEAPASQPDMKQMVKLPMEPEMDAQPCPICGKVHSMGEEECGVEEEWDNAPDEEYSDHKKMTHDLSGGINRRKKSYAAAQPGDNAMAVESLKQQLSAEWKKKVNETK